MDRGLHAARGYDGRVRKLLPLVLGLALLTPTSAPAATPSCGSQIAHDVTFDRDLSCLDGGVTIAADGVKVDLNGFRLSSDHSTLVSNPGFDHVKVLNGRLTTQGFAIEMSGGHHNLVRNVSGFGDLAGVWLHDGSHNRIVDSTLDCRQVCLRGASYLLERERRDTIRGNGPLDGAIVLHDTQRSVLNGNQVVDPASSAGSAVELDADSHRNRVTDNEVQDCRPAPAVTVAGDRNRLLRNDIRGCAGLLVTGTRNRLIANQVSGSFADGIRVTIPGNRLGDNVATDNALLGINAVFGTIDLGGNRASGNGDPRQCVGVTCSP